MVRGMVRGRFSLGRDHRSKWGRVRRVIYIGALVILLLLVVWTYQSMADGVERSVQLVDEAGNPVLNCTVSIANRTLGTWRIASTGIDGSVDFAGDGYGRVEISVISKGLMARTINVTLRPYDSFHSSVTVYRVVANAFGRVRSESGEPIGEARVILYDQNLSYIGETESRDNGRYSLDLPEGSWIVKFASDDMMPIVQRVTATEGSSVEIDVTLRRAEARLEGVVLDSLGGSVDRARVFIFSQDSYTSILSCLTDEYGSFGISLEPGLYSITVRYRDLIYYPVLVSVGLTGTQQIEVRPQPTGRVEGLVLRRDGTGIGEAQVSVYNPRGELLTRTATDSFGAFEMGLPSGVFSIKADAEGYVIAEERVRVDMDRTGPVIVGFVTMGEAIEVEGVVRTLAEQPIPGAWVEVLDADSRRWVTTALADQNGEFSIGLKEGRWIFSVMADGVDREEVEVILPYKDSSAAQQRTGSGASLSVSVLW